ncbi:MAG: hypothetical protein LQ346_003284 [Caloplaca aetnensis]|nr:MAG: hypothetical protein LQ346_003284 [Caloplaca aetnensis]
MQFHLRATYTGIEESNRSVFGHRCPEILRWAKSPKSKGGMELQKFCRFSGNMVSELLMVVEYKAPHKLTLSILELGPETEIDDCKIRDEAEALRKRYEACQRDSYDVEK